MNLATWSLRNPVPVVVLFALLTIAGVWGFLSLPKQDLPDLEFPTVTVSVAQPGAAPAQLETEIARRIENAVAAVAGLKHMATTVTDGNVTVMAQFQLDKPLDTALAETKEAVDGIRSDLPQDILPPVVAATTVVGGEILAYAVTAPDKDEAALSWFVDDIVSRGVLKVDGVGRFQRIGGVDREVRVEVDPVRLAGVNVTAAEVSRALRSMQQQNSGGRTQISSGEQSVRVIATVAEAGDLAAMPIVAGGKRLRLDQVATVTDTTGERTEGALMDGRQTVAFNIYRARGADELKIALGVNETLDRIRAAHPGVIFTPIADNTQYTLQQFEGSMHMLIEGSILAVVVVFLFLRDWRATAIAATALPLSILPTFAAMAWMGFTLNTITMLALAVSVGILVDDAIVEVENIARHRQRGKSALHATSDAVNEIALAVLATTLTLVAVFLPTSLMPGLAGLFFKQFGWTAAFAVLASLLVARLVTPLMAARMFKDHAPAPQADSWLMARYLTLVRWCLSHRWATLALTGAAFLGSLAIVPILPTGLIPASDSGQTQVSIELPPGSAYAETLASAERARAALINLKGVASVFTVIGAAQEGAGGEDVAGSVRHATLILRLKDKAEREPLQRIERRVRVRLAEVPGIRYSVGGGGAPGESFALVLAGDDSAALIAASHRLETELRALGSLSSVASTASLDRTELVVRPNLTQAAERGVLTSDIGETIRIATSGDFVADLARLNLENRQVPIRARMADTERADLQTLADLRVRSGDGAVPLGAIAHIAMENGPSQIDRFDRQRIITISADLNGMASGDAMKQAMALPAVRNLPPSVTLVETGDAEFGAELGAGFIFALVTGILCMLCVLILLFKNALQPFTILSAIPLALGGVFLALLITGSELNLPVMIGVVLLTGVVTKNSILLVEYAITGIHKRQLGRVDALVAACHARARPILMTSVAMIAGMAPIALGFGADASFRQPMAIAVIGGLITSTLLSLVFVPVVFSMTAGFERRVGNLFRRKGSRSTSSAEEPLPT